MYKPKIFDCFTTPALKDQYPTEARWDEKTVFFMVKRKDIPENRETIAIISLKDPSLLWSNVSMVNETPALWWDENSTRVNVEFSLGKIKRGEYKVSTAIEPGWYGTESRIYIITYECKYGILIDRKCGNKTIIPDFKNSEHRTECLEYYYPEPTIYIV